MVPDNSLALHAPHVVLAATLKQRLEATRSHTEMLAAVLSDEDQVVQAMDDASPTKWHFAHTTWFFETFILEKHLPGYERYNEDFQYCFNSYYENAGPRHPRPQRGILTRPSSQQVRDYRARINDGLDDLFAHFGDELPDGLADLIELGVNHEQQHQELILTDILSLFAQNPLRPAYRSDYLRDHWAASRSKEERWVSHAGGIHQIGVDGTRFHFDNETPTHPVLLRPYRLRSDLVSNDQWLAFIEDEGYRTATLWLSDGWAAVQSNGWTAPGYWQHVDGEWHQMTLAGLTPVNSNAPVSHVSFYEAEAFARWAGRRLPTEFEWEVALSSGEDEFDDAFGQVWQWTSSAYSPYPGYRPAEGAIGEYNGKFMCNQYVLRGSSHATPVGHSRITYRNFFYPDARWQFTGLRLAEDVA